MESVQRGPSLLDEAVEVAKARLAVGEELIPLLITDRWGDRHTERFGANALSDAKTKAAAFLRTAAGEESCALVYLGRVEDDEDAILIERGGAGYGPSDVFIQRFRPRRGRFRRFKLIGKPEPVGSTDAMAEPTRINDASAAA